MSSVMQPVGTMFNALTPGSKIVGNIKAVSDIRLDGTLEGDLDCTSKVIVGEKGIVKGNVNASNIEINGSITGKIVCTGTLLVRATGVINGDVTTQTLVIEPKAIFNGTCKMPSGNTTSVGTAK